MDYKGIIINNLRAKGTLTPAEQRAQYKNAVHSLNTPYDVVIKDCDFGLNGYNYVEIGLNSTVEPPRSILIENCNFSGVLSNNAILVFGTQDNATVTIRNCKFNSVSNMLRISNRTNASGVLFNIEDCTVDSYDKTPAWRAVLLFENYTDKTADAIEANNRFSPDKIMINIKNLICEGKPFAPSTIKSVTNTAAEDQLIVWCNDYMQGEGYIPAPDTIIGKLPKIFVDGVEIPVDVENAGE